ncbi:hypothetical protein CPB83DRAFT_815981 [Crepidotus variabilis]|uniref:RNA-binding S4 domain-containing protein n=1 Tax=Crepidotus variabilis TaxID=179855 RepID=A0A9P6ED57_9AGAR|nr:hypothetical protein CPB83DRAFT_815981 [Crepidotus variabilis]
MRNKNVLNLRKSLPCMSWSPKNLYNLWKRTAGPQAARLAFKSTTEATIFQQRWKSKAAVRAYHGDFIPEKVFKRWYLPDTLPDVRPRREILERRSDKMTLEEFAKRNEKQKDLDEEIEEKGLAPVGSLMFSEVERRLDVFVFRSCFAHSVYDARRLIIHGWVTLNGKKHSKANTRLAPGDMVHVDPRAIRFFKKPNGEYDDVNGLEAKAEAQLKESAEPPAEATPKAEAVPVEASEAKAEAEASTAKDTPSDSSSKSPPLTPPESPKKPSLTPFYLPPYASPHLFIPAYIEVSFLTCSAIYVRHPTARPGYSEIPTPYDADGAVVRFAWEWYVQRRARMRSQRQLSRAPEDRVVTVLNSLYQDKRMLKLGQPPPRQHVVDKLDKLAQTASATTTEPSQVSKKRQKAYPISQTRVTAPAAAA